MMKGQKSKRGAVVKLEAVRVGGRWLTTQARSLDSSPPLTELEELEPVTPAGNGFDRLQSAATRVRACNPPVGDDGVLTMRMPVLGKVPPHPARRLADLSPPKRGERWQNTGKPAAICEAPRPLPRRAGGEVK